MKAYKCDICGKLYEKTEKIKAQRIKITLAVAKYTNIKQDICESCYDYFVNCIGMEKKAYFPPEEVDETEDDE